MRARRSGANGCRVTDRHPQEGPSFRTGLDGPPLILVVQFAGVHGNRGIIIINTGFKFSRGEWQLRGTRRGTTDSPGAAVPLREDQDPRAAGGWPREAAPSSGWAQEAEGARKGPWGPVSEARSSCGARGEPSSFPRSCRGAATPRPSQRTARHHAPVIT